MITHEMFCKMSRFPVSADEVQAWREEGNPSALTDVSLVNVCRDRIEPDMMDALLAQTVPHVVKHMANGVPPEIALAGLVSGVLQTGLALGREE